MPEYPLLMPVSGQVLQLVILRVIFHSRSTEPLPSLPVCARSPWANSWARRCERHDV